MPSPPASVDDPESEEENHRLVNGGKGGAYSWGTGGGGQRGAAVPHGPEQIG